MNGKPIDMKAVSEVLALNDEQLKQAVHALAVAGGMNEARAAAISRDADRIRRRLSTVTEADLQKLLRAVNVDQLQTIADQLKQMR